MKRGSKQPKAKGAGKMPGVRSESVNMMGKSVEPWMKKAKKPEADAKPKVSGIGAASTNKNSKSQNSARVKRLTGTMI